MLHCRLETLNLTDFRSYSAAEYNFGAESVVLWGENGAGKTNVLEAISFLSPGRGLRRGRLADVPRQGSSGNWAVSATGLGLQGAFAIGTGVQNITLVNDETRFGEDEGEKRQIHINGKKSRGQAELARHLIIVWLTPQMDGLFLEGGSARRRYLDRIVSLFDAEHSSRLASYEHVVRERNRLLGFGGPKSDANWLFSLEQKIAEKSAEIAVARMNLVDILNGAIMMAPDAFPKARISLHGTLEDAMMRGESALQSEAFLQSRLASSRDDDARSGRTSDGAHVSSLVVMHQGKNMEAALCSTGEQKAMLLSLTLAQVRAARDWKHASPILLLDEVVAHLDTRRRAELFEAVRNLGAQTFLTGTDAADFSDWQKAAMFMEVKSGEQMNKATNISA